MPRFPLLALAACYRAAYKLHHSLCLRPGKPLRHASLYVIGSFRIGGAGKTPFSAWLAQFILENSCSTPGELVGSSNTAGKDAPRVAILCHSKAADEAQMLRQKFSGKLRASVFVTGNRYHTAHEIDSEFDIIICDDGFEDTRLVNAHVIRLDWEAPPRGIADLFPAGRCRSLPADHAQPALVLNCGSDTHSGSGKPADVLFKIASIANCNGAAPQESPTPLVLCGIADRKRFAGDIAAFGIRAQCGPARPDHDSRFGQTLSALLEKGEQVIVTEKDLARLGPELSRHPGLFVARQQITLSPGAENAVKALCGLQE